MPVLFQYVVEVELNNRVENDEKAIVMYVDVDNDDDKAINGVGNDVIEVETNKRVENDEKAIVVYAHEDVDDTINKVVGDIDDTVRATNDAVEMTEYDATIREGVGGILDDADGFDDINTVRHMNDAVEEIEYDATVEEGVGSKFE